MIPDELEDKLENALHHVVDRIDSGNETSSDIPGLVGAAIHLFEFRQRVVAIKSDEMGETDKTNH